MLLTNETKLVSVCMICHFLLLDFHLVKILNNFEEYYIYCIFYRDSFFKSPKQTVMKLEYNCIRNLCMWKSEKSILNKSADLCIVTVVVACEILASSSDLEPSSQTVATSKSSQLLPFYLDIPLNAAGAICHPTFLELVLNYFWI